MSNRTDSPTRKPAAAKAARGRRPQSQDLRAAKDALYREHIMEAAERIFAEQGFDATKMQDIARAVGISLGTLYQAYPGKSELHRAILVARSGQMFNVVMAKGQPIFRQPKTIEHLLWLMNAHLLFLLQHPDYLRIQLQQGHAWYHSTAWPSSDEEMLWKQGLALMQQIFAWGQAEGMFIPGDVTDQARLMMALQQTRLANWVGDGMKESHDDVIAHVQADFVRNFCRPQVAAGLLSPEGDHLNEAATAKLRAIDRAG